MRSQIVVFPFDLFGSAGTSAGAKLLGDAVREMIDDTSRETRASRADAFRGKLKVREIAFDNVESISEWRKRGRQVARQILKSGDKIIWLGGNHLSILPLIEELAELKDCIIIQFDAHLDIYSFHDTATELSHGNFLRHTSGPRPKLVNIGHRDLFLTAREIEETFTITFSVSQLIAQTDTSLTQLEQLAISAKRVWIDLDCDAFDPAFLPAVNQPLPFGLSSEMFLRILELIWSDRVIGISISEFDPGRDNRDVSLNLLGWLLEFILLKWHESE